MRSISALVAALVLALSLSPCSMPAAPAEQAPSPGGRDQPPRPIYQGRPAFPARLRDLGMQGFAYVDFTIDKQGMVREAQSIATNDPAFGANAVACVGKWRFSPQIKGGQTVDTHMAVPLFFTLNMPSPKMEVGNDITNICLKIRTSWVRSHSAAARLALTKLPFPPPGGVVRIAVGPEGRLICDGPNVDGDPEQAGMLSFVGKALVNATYSPEFVDYIRLAQGFSLTLPRFPSGGSSSPAHASAP